MADALVSVLIPAYNAERWLAKCLDTVLAQTYRQLQVVVVDDGSTDGTAALLDTYAAADPRIEAVHRPNGGVASARNELISRVRGEWILFIDADDWVEPDMVATLLGLAGRHEALIACCGMVWDDGPMATGPWREETWDVTTLRREFVRHQRHLSGSLWNKLIHASLLHTDRRLGPAPADTPRFDPRVSYGEDALWLWQLIKRLSPSDRAALTSRPLYHYRRNLQSLSHRYDDGRRSCRIFWENLAHDCETSFPELATEARTNQAAADYWLLIDAIKGGAPLTDFEKACQTNLRGYLHGIRHLKLLPPRHLATATLMCLNLHFARPIIKKLTE